MRLKDPTLYANEQQEINGVAAMKTNKFYLPSANDD